MSGPGRHKYQTFKGIKGTLKDLPWHTSKAKNREQGIAGIQSLSFRWLSQISDYKRNIHGSKKISSKRKNLFFSTSMKLIFYP